ncbi:glycosyltransferase [Azospirillum picis]|uniref:GT2 family glycosyltransferase n=1 Tax=Azospirillum picis TaxID=488438 RepID=A0ABU0MH48_9PROT|nr:glycosyltransferase [Azospirillum picis]MBP2298994.1 GT2 family glycosyltransferase [Azospirillum picis]MDQ0532764.1 GT2 family glycosyltransferase [Azospirillum picis]
MTVIAVLPNSVSIAPAQRLALGRRFVLISWTMDGAPDGSAASREPLGSITPEIGGRPVRPPFTTLTINNEWGGRRILSILPAPQDPSEPIRFVAGNRVVAELRAEAGGADLDPAGLLGSLEGPARLRVLRFFFDFACSTPALRRDAGFAALCRRLVLDRSADPATLAVRAEAGGGLLLCAGALAPRFGAITGLVVLSTDRVIPAPFDACVGNDPAGRGRVAFDLLIDRDLCTPGNLLVVLGANGMACRRFPERPTAVPTLTERLNARPDTPAAVRHYLLSCMAERGRSEPSAASAVTELQALAPLPRRQAADARRPIGASLDLAVPTADGGLFLAGWLHDPHGLAADLVVRTPFGGERRVDAFPHRFPREDVAKLYGSAGVDRSGFVLHLPGSPEAGEAMQVTADLRLASGGSLPLVPAPRPRAHADARAAVLGSLPPRFATPELLRTVIAPAVAPLHAAHLATRGEPELIVFGERPAVPPVSVIIPLYRTLEFLRFQISSFATDPAMREVELVFVLDSPEQRDEVAHLLRGFHALYGLPMLLLVQTANFGYSAANNAGVATARGNRLLFLNSDVVPDRAGWLPALVAALDERPGTGAVGPKLLFDDDSLQHAGLYFDRDLQGAWYNHHFFKGLPREFAPACLPRRVPGVTGACLLTTRAIYAAAGGFCEDYVIGDFEDSDLCLRIREQGLDIRYTPSVELYHLERRSIGRHQGYTRGVASEYNRWLHGRRWAGPMAELMARDWFAGDEAPLPAKRARKTLQVTR